MISLKEIYPVDYLEKALSSKDNSEIGTPIGHYASPDKGPFECANCIHFDGKKLCGHPKVIQDAKNGELELDQNKAVVQKKGCCNYFNSGK